MRHPGAHIDSLAEPRLGPTYDIQGCRLCASLRAMYSGSTEHVEAFLHKGELQAKRGSVARVVTISHSWLRDSSCMKLGASILFLPL